MVCLYPGMMDHSYLCVLLLESRGGVAMPRFYQVHCCVEPVCDGLILQQAAMHDNW